MDKIDRFSWKHVVCFLAAALLTALLIYLGYPPAYAIVPAIVMAMLITTTTRSHKD